MKFKPWLLFYMTLFAVYAIIHANVVQHFLIDFNSFAEVETTLYLYSTFENTISLYTHIKPYNVINQT